MFQCDPIIECQLNPGTKFKGPLKGEDVIWEITSRIEDKILLETEVNGEVTKTLDGKITPNVEYTDESLCVILWNDLKSYFIYFYS